MVSLHTVLLFTNTLYTSMNALFTYRRERSSGLNLSSEVDSDFLAELEDQLTSPSSFYTGTGGKPPLAFAAVGDAKSHRKR